MHLQILASGSTGNSAFLEIAGQKFLIDAGISCRRIEVALAELGLAVTDLDGVFVTHEHHDHVAGLKTLQKKYQLPVFTRSATGETLMDSEQLFSRNFNVLEEKISLGDVKIEAFDIPHDAVEPVGFTFSGEGLKCVFLTDLGTITPEVLKAAQGAQVIVLEANHDPQMLKEGSYPAWLKARIRGRTGHLSNQQAGGFLASIYAGNVINVFLSHISRENNYLELAKRSIERRLAESFSDAEKKINLLPTYPDKISGLQL